MVSSFRHRMHPYLKKETLAIQIRLHLLLLLCQAFYFYCHVIPCSPFLFPLLVLLNPALCRPAPFHGTYDVAGHHSKMTKTYEISYKNEDSTVVMVENRAQVQLMKEKVRRKNDGAWKADGGR